MGIIDDYYGGYETIAQFTDEDGNTDFDAAYDHANGLDEYDYEEEGQEEVPEEATEEEVTDEKEDDGAEDDE